MIKQIAILTANGKVNVKGISKNGLALHRTVTDMGPLGYTVTHEKSGRALIYCRNLLHAKRVMKKLSELDIPWQAGDPIEISKFPSFDAFRAIHKMCDVYYGGAK